MKKYLLGVFALVLVSSCDLLIVEEFPYDGRNNFIGRFEAEEYSETFDGFTFYDVRIVRDSDFNSPVIYLRNFYGLDFEVYAEVFGDKLTIPTQRIDGFVIQGTGRLDYEDIVLTYSVEGTERGNRYIEFCNTVYDRR
jgi:hypothetical protein